MFAKLFALFALVAVAMAAPAPAPQVYTYSTGLEYAYPAVPSVVSPYSAPLAYSAYPGGAVYLR